ncbi:MAG: hypothetical protein PHQ19_09035, partial [Candidatus Krumholzibacteria bacterium]|nr:hypothetical protein [Candidatus Krumholzibacteria bacterium]
MKRRICVVSAIAAAMLSAGAEAQDMVSYYHRTPFLFAPPGAFGVGLLGFANPALPRMLGSPEGRFLWAPGEVDQFGLEDWGLFSGAPGI